MRYSVDAVQLKRFTSPNGDLHFSLPLPISEGGSSCLYHIRDLQCIRHYLDLNSANLLANTLVPSRLDYGNSLLFGIADTDLTKLQHVQNRGALFGKKSPPFNRSVPLLCSLHWLPVKFRVDFKICSLTYKTLHEKQPSLHACHIAPIPFTEIKQKNLSVSS